MGDDGGVQEDSQKPKSHSPEKIDFQSHDGILNSLLQNLAGNSRPRRKRERQAPKIQYVSPEVVYSTPFTLENMMHSVSLAYITCGLFSLKNKAAQRPRKRFGPTKDPCSMSYTLLCGVGDLKMGTGDEHDY
uniref:Uncharacterized protein n=1 Tax=Attheya septentrionalis TaxID=420275 RepID=A0A7S2XKI3_9STRA